MKRFAILFLIIFVATTTKAQTYKYEAGGGVGMGFYMGDINPNTAFKDVGFAAEATFRWNINYRWAIKTGISTSTLKGTTSGLDFNFPELTDYSFKRQVIDFGVQGEFNFFKYGMEKGYLDTKRLSPYILMGFGFCVVPAKGDSYFNVNLPIGAGVKYKLAKRWNLALEFTMRKTLGDKLDGKSADDPLLIESSAFKNSDWYSHTMVTITYNFGIRTIICNNNN